MQAVHPAALEWPNSARPPQVVINPEVARAAGLLLAATASLVPRNVDDRSQNPDRARDQHDEPTCWQPRENLVQASQSAHQMSDITPLRSDDPVERFPGMDGRGA